MTASVIRGLCLAAAATALLAGCQEGSGGPFAKKAATGTESPVAGAKSVKLVDRDTEAPEVFQTTDDALWDGRPSLGGVWVASPDAKDPERVILRNPSNGKFVIGALFRREIDNPGPKLQISSDAASALGMLAGAPSKISVTALRREEAAASPDASKPILDSSETVATETLDPIPGAAAALDRATAKPPAKPTSPGAAPTITAEAIPAGTIVPSAANPAASQPAATSAKPASSGAGSTIQIGIFSVEANANRAAATLKAAGLAAEVRKETSQGKSFWSVTSRGDKATLDKVKKAGFQDAYFVKG